MQFIDTHCHLTDEQFDADREAVIERAVEAGVTRLITLATDVVSSRAAIALAEQHACVYAAVGIHPQEVGDATYDDVEVIRELAGHPKVVAIGEIGLDYYWDPSAKEAQQPFFEKQLELAAELGLPVAIHSRRAEHAVLDTLRRQNHLGTRGVLHAFAGDVAMAQAAFELGYLVSFGGAVTFLNNRRAPALIQALPLEKILLETDAPYLTPHPERGTRNEPAKIVRVAARIAELKGVSVEQIAAQTTQNALELFAREKRG